MRLHSASRCSSAKSRTRWGRFATSSCGTTNQYSLCWSVNRLRVQWKALSMRYELRGYSKLKNERNKRKRSKARPESCKTLPLQDKKVALRYKAGRSCPRNRSFLRSSRSSRTTRLASCWVQRSSLPSGPTGRSRKYRSWRTTLKLSKMRRSRLHRLYILSQVGAKRNQRAWATYREYQMIHSTPQGMLEVQVRWVPVITGCMAQ